MPFTAQELTNIANAALDFYIKGPAMAQSIQKRPTLDAFKSKQKTFPGGKADIRRNVKGSYTSSFVGYTHESAYLLAKGRPQTPDRPIPDVIPWKYTGNRHHPTEKPVQSLRPLIESLTRPGAIVLDPFAGSGSTCVAAAEASRRYIGIEMLEEYHAAGVRRLAQVERARRMPAANDGAFYPDWPEAA